MPSNTSLPLRAALSQYDQTNEQQVRDEIEQRLRAVESVSDPSGVGSSLLADNSVTNAKLRDSAALSVIGRATNSAGDPDDIAAGSNDTLLRRVSNALGFGALTAGMIPANLIALAKLAQGTALSVLGVAGNAGADYADIAAGSDHQVMRRSGTSIGFGAVALDQAAAVTGVLPIGSGGTNAGDAATAFGNLKQAASTSATGVVELAIDSEVRASATGDKVLTSEHLETSAAPVAMTDATTVTFDWDAGYNRTLEITTDRMLGNPSNGIPGQWRTILLSSDGGPDELTFGSNYGGELPTLDDVTTTQWYLLSIYCVTTSHFLVFAADGSPP